MNDNEPLPVNIDVNRLESFMRIGWNDGHESRYPFMLLRAACPCASCRGGHEKMSKKPDVKAFETRLPDGPGVRVVDVQAAGSYGISIRWADGHHYGIYSWHFLRALCPCSACRPTE